MDLPDARHIAYLYDNGACPLPPQPPEQIAKGRINETWDIHGEATGTGVYGARPLPPRSGPEIAFDFSEDYVIAGGNTVGLPG